MKHFITITAIVAIGFLALFFPLGCASITEAINSLDSVFESDTDTAQSDTEEAPAEQGGQDSMQGAMVAMVVVSQALFTGGFAEGYDHFNEGEGVTWEVRSKSNGKATTVKVERALLKVLKDKSEWWYLKYAAEGEDTIISEALLSNDFGLLKFRYRDNDSGEIREWIPEQDSSQSDSGKRTGKDGKVDTEDYKDNIVGTEKISTPAGTFTAKHIIIEIKDPAGGEEPAVTNVYEWWLSEKVPGELVRYFWKDSTVNKTVSGELVSIKNGYTSELGSF